MRAIRARYDPYKQTRDRVEQLSRLGHQVDKVEFIVMGGTFMSLPVSYRDYFIRNLHDALSGHTSASVEEAVKYSEQSLTKCIGLTIETRPDYFLKPHISQMLQYGCTRVEVGVQCQKIESRHIRGELASILRYSSWFADSTPLIAFILSCLLCVLCSYV